MCVCVLSLELDAGALSWKPQPPNSQPLACRRKQTPLSFNGSECDEPVSTSESDAVVVKEDERSGSAGNQINEEVQRMLNHL